jgi:pSer/pThr/pTyr-binding forkhead associated (FHA) protein
VQLEDPSVSRFHVKVWFDGEQWRVKDLESANGTYLDGTRIQEVALPGKAVLELGQGGPVLSLVVEQPEDVSPEEEPASKKTEEKSSVTQIVQHYFDKSSSGQAGEHTMMFRQAFDRVHKKRSMKYWVIIGVVAFLLVGAGGIAVFQQLKFKKIRSTAEEIFYAMKTLELQIGQLEEFILSKAEPDLIEDILSKREQLREMEKSYERFVKDIGVYNKKMSEEEKIILQMARIFGECELNVPEGFADEVENYIKKWQSSQRLVKAIERARRRGYPKQVIKVMTEHHLSPHFFFLALQESDFRSRVVGPQTRYGYAKGIWQFIPMTAQDYGLKLGPLFKEKRYDPKDERFDFTKATKAAAKYIKFIYNTEAQASGLLVMASYNWGESNVRKIILTMPENPKERNFWKLLAHHTIPKETYDYVFYIFSAAVIGENPRLFGFDFERPLPERGADHEQAT